MKIIIDTLKWRGRKILLFTIVMNILILFLFYSSHAQTCCTVGEMRTVIFHPVAYHSGDHSIPCRTASQHHQYFIDASNIEAANPGITPTVTLTDFINIMQTGNIGIFYIESHGNDNEIAIEFYADDSTGLRACNDARDSYNNLGYGSYIRVAHTISGYCICINNTGIQNWCTGLNETLVYAKACHSSGLNDDWRALVAIGYNEEEPLLEYAGTDVFFERMDGYRERGPMNTRRSINDAVDGITGWFIDPQFHYHRWTLTPYTDLNSNPYGTNVVLSPVVLDHHPENYGLVEEGQDGFVEFDCEMNQSVPANQVVSMTGTIGSLTNVHWTNNHRIEYKVTNLEQFATINFKVLADKAISQHNNSQLDGNTNPNGTDGAGPNGDFYTWTSLTSHFAMMDFEDGIDRAPIKSTIPGMEFITTAGFDWIYGDKRTNEYNIYPYLEAKYWCNGNFFAWLGPNQGQGRINFTGATATSICMGTSNANGLHLDAYDKNGNLIASDGVSGNLETNTLSQLKVSGSQIDHVLVHNSGNYWLIDDLMVIDLLQQTLILLPENFAAVLDELHTISPGSTENFLISIDNAVDKLQTILNWLGSEMKLTIYKPDGQMYGEYQTTNPPIQIEIPNPMSGEWKFKVTAVNIPNDNYPYSLVVGTQEEPQVDLFITSNDIWFYPENPYQGQMVNVFAVVQSDYLSKLVEYARVRCYLGNPASGGVQIDEDEYALKLYSGSRDTVYFHMNTENLNGNKEIFIKIDPDDELKEYREDNNISSKIINITPNNLSEITVISPNGGEVWYVGTSYNITWTSDKYIGKVIIEISTDGGNSWSDVTQGAYTANDGSYSYTPIMQNVSSHCLFKVTSIQNPAAKDQSNAEFSIISQPTVTTTAATNITSNSAQLNGTVNPNGASTSYYFQYGMTTSYGSTTPSIDIGSGTSAVTVYRSVTGLNVNTTYHFRIVATFSGGTSYGNDLTFTTLTSQTAFFDNFEDGNANGWTPKTSSRWSVVKDEGDYSYFLNTSDYTEDEFSILEQYVFTNFDFSLKAKSPEDLIQNPAADYKILFGYQNYDNTYLLKINHYNPENKLYRIVNGDAVIIVNYDGLTIPDNAYHDVRIIYSDPKIEIYFDGLKIMSVSDGTFPAGKIGIGSFNDAVYFDDVSISSVSNNYVTLSGKVECIGGPLNNITINFSNSGGTTHSDNNGHFQKLVPKGWSGVVAPVHQCWTFTPPSYSFQNVTSDIGNINFAADDPMQRFTISGYVRTSNGNGISGVFVDFGSAGHVNTDGNGYYSNSNVICGWSGTATPFKDGYNFSPANLSFNNVLSDLSDQNFIGYGNITPQFVYHAKKVANSAELPVVDGLLDEPLWSYINEDSLLYGGIPVNWDVKWWNWNDNLVTWKAVWSEQTNRIYVAVSVRDDVKGIFDNNNPNAVPYLPHYDDSIEFFTDGDNSGGDYGGEFDVAQQWRVSGENIRNLSNSLPDWNTDIYTGTDFITATKYYNNGNWTCEASFKIYNELPSIPKTLNIGDAIGWNIWYNDSDNETFKNNHYERDHQTGWNYTGPAWEDADYFGDLLLDAEISIPYITVTVPNGNETWYVGNNYNITWDVQNITGNVNIEYSGNNGGTWTLLTNCNAALKSWNWTPQTSHISNQCLIKISDLTGTISDVSNNTFAIKPTDNLPSHWNFTSNTGNNANVVLPVSANPNINSIPLVSGDYIGVFTPVGLCCGWKQWQGSNLNIVVWGDNDQTPGIIDGFKSGELISYRVYRVSEQKEWASVSVVYSQGTGYFSSNAMMILQHFDVSDQICINLDFEKGWNMFSINIIPANPDITEVMSPINNKLVLVKTGDGEIYFPAYGINEIGNIDCKEGYQAYLNDAALLEVCGQPLDPTIPIELPSGWSMIGYLPSVPIDVSVALASIVNKLLLAKDCSGNIYMPLYGINDIGQMQPGQGYQVYLTGNATLIYPSNLSSIANMMNPETETEISESAKTTHFQYTANTGANAIIVILTDTHPKYSDGSPLNIGDEIGVFSSTGICCGAIVWENVNKAFTIWGDDNQTDDVDGLKEDEHLYFRIWNKEENVEYIARVGYQGEKEGNYKTDDFAVLNQLTADLTTDVNSIDKYAIPTEFEILPNYPNPFNPKTNIHFKLPQANHVEICVYNMQGQLVTTLINEFKEGGDYQTLWNAKDEPTGIYFCTLRAGQFEKTIKLMLVK